MDAGIGFFRSLIRIISNTDSSIRLRIIKLICHKLKVYPYEY